MGPRKSEKKFDVDQLLRKSGWRSKSWERRADQWSNPQLRVRISEFNQHSALVMEPKDDQTTGRPRYSAQEFVREGRRRRLERSKWDDDEDVGFKTLNETLQDGLDKLNRLSVDAYGIPCLKLQDTHDPIPMPSRRVEPPRTPAALPSEPSAIHHLPRNSPMACWSRDASLCSAVSHECSRLRPLSINARTAQIEGLPPGRPDFLGAPRESSADASVVISAGTDLFRMSMDVMLNRIDEQLCNSVHVISRKRCPLDASNLAPLTVRPIPPERPVK